MPSSEGNLWDSWRHPFWSTTSSHGPCGRNKAHFVTSSLALALLSTLWCWACSNTPTSSQTSFPEAPCKARCKRGVWTNGCFPWASLYTFQAISYIVDVHRGTLARPTSLLSLATYITFFPQLVAGPIVRAKQFLPQLQSKLWTSNQADDARHVQLILGGFLKKLVLGDLVGAWLVDPVFERPAEWVSWEVMLALYGYSLQVYADFSGYTDMAKGMAGLLGIALPENFRFPYRATSPSDFWRRWHITLSQWWKDYVYIPLGGNRRFSALSLLWVASMLFSGMVLWGELGGVLLLAGGTLLAVAGVLMAPRVQAKLATVVNVLIVMLLGGLWHGAHVNFVTWGR